MTNIGETPMLRKNRSAFRALSWRRAKIIAAHLAPALLHAAPPTNPNNNADPRNNSECNQHSPHRATGGEFLVMAQKSLPPFPQILHRHDLPRPA
jgi:hypothetical protein